MKEQEAGPRRQWLLWI